MYPMYGWMDSHPHPRNQIVYAPYHTQSFEPVPPPHIKMEPARPAMFEPWPHGGSYGYSYPTECHGCCNHNYFPGHYGFRPPCLHYPPPPPAPHSYHGSYPPFIGAYPGYQIPPPHFSVEQPRYEYDKGFPRDQHCCGCSSHSCKRESDENVKIEERQTDTDKKSSGSLVPTHLRNFPFPFAMIPPHYLMDSDGSKSAKSEGKEDKKFNHEKECDRSSKSLNTSGSVLEKETERQQDIQSQLPFPLFWLPYKPEEVEKDDLKGMNSGQKAVIAPIPDNNVKTPSSAADPKMIENDAAQMTTPVKRVEQVEETKKDEERKVKSIPVVQADDIQDKGSAGNSDKKRGSSPKSSKLPPVCLRVDPRPKSKKVNGGSRSPSPPAAERRSRQSPNENSKSLGQNDQSQKEVDKSKEVESREKNIQVVEGTLEGKREAQTNNRVPPSHEEGPLRKSRVEGVNDIVNQGVGEGIENEKARLEGQLVNKEEANKMRRKISDSEAAVTIQSVYRGFEVRKSEPLKKLRQVAEITQKMLEVKSRISTLDSSSDVEIDEKQLVVIGETIMGLLLKLDTIQGLHSFVRDVRKSVAKELVSLQEKLDSLTARKAQASVVAPSSETQKGPTVIVADNISVESNQNEVKVVLESTQGNGIDTDAQSGNNHVENGITGPEHVEKSELRAAEELGNNTTELASVNSVGLQRPDSDREMELEDQEYQALKNGDGQMTTESEESLKLDGAVETQVEVVGSSSLVELSGEVDEAEPINLPHGIHETTTETAGDLGSRNESVVEDIKVDSAAESRNLDTEEDSYLGREEMHDEEALVKHVSQTEKHEVVSDTETGNVSPMEDHELKTETEISSSVQEKEATDNGEDLNEANITPELVSPIMEDKVHDGEIKEAFNVTNIDEGDGNSPLLPEEHSEKELQMPNNMVDQVDQPREHLDQMTIVQSENLDKGDMEKGGEMVMEENKRLKEMMEKLIEAGNEQLVTITKLSGKVKDLEKKLSKNKKLKTKKKPRGKRQDMVLV